MKGTRLKLLREEMGLKQSELASRLAVSASTIGMYERGYREPSDTMKIKIASFFNVTVDYLMGNSDERSYKVMSDDDIKADMVIRFYQENAHKINEKDKKILLNFIKSYFESKENEE